MPVRVLAGRDHRLEVLAAPGEQVVIPGGAVELYVEAPGYRPWRSTTVLDSDHPLTVVLDPDELDADPDAGPVAVPHGLTTAFVPWTAPRQAAPHDALTVPAVGLRLAAHRIPRRLLAVPASSPHDQCRLVWRASPGAGRRPRIEPVDGGGRLLMEYLLTGRSALAAAAARSVERVRGDEEPLNWAAPSYTQLLIGYAYAAGHDRRRLSDWCARTAARTELGADGLILAAETAWWNNRPDEVRTLLARAAVLPPPSILFGGEIAVRLASRIALRSGTTMTQDPEADRLVLRLSNDYLRLLSQADGGAANLSVAATRNPSLDLTGAPLPHRLPWLLRHALFRLWRLLTLTLDRSTKEHTMVDFERHESRRGDLRQQLRVGWPLASVVLAAAAGIGVNVATGRPAPGNGLWWLLAGALGAFAFLAAGAFATALLLRGRTARAEREADRAERLAEHYRQDAMRGRALMAVLLAEQPERGPYETADTDVVERHARIARRLFDLDDGRDPQQITPEIGPEESRP